MSSAMQNILCFVSLTARSQSSLCSKQGALVMERAHSVIHIESEENSGDKMQMSC